MQNKLVYMILQNVGSKDCDCNLFYYQEKNNICGFPIQHYAYATADHNMCKYTMTLLK